MFDSLTFIVTFRNGHHLIERTLDSIPSSCRVIVVDDSSDVAYRTERENVRVIRTNERAYPAGACNLGIESCETDVILMGQDNQLVGDAWKELVVQRERYGVIGDGIFGHPAWPNGYVQATWMLMRRDAIKATGLFNDKYYPAWGCTAEWQVRMCRKGFKALPVKIPGLSHEGGRKRNLGESMQQAIQQEPEKASLFLSTPPAITVAIPCYNYGRYLEDAIHSLIGGKTSLGEHPGQSLQSFEVYIVDDTSTDNSSSYGKALADPWQGIHFIQHPVNKGTAATLNTGIRAGHGKFATFLSADDMMEPDRLEYLYEAALKNSHSIIYDDITIMRDGQRLKSWSMSEYDFDTLLTRNHVPYALMYTRKAFEEVGGYPEQFGKGREDWAMAVRMGVHGYCGVHVPKAGLLYRREKQNRSLKNTDPYHHQKFLGMLREMYPDIYMGRRPNMCCGNRSKKASPTRTISKSAALLALPGADGMTRLEYIGNKSGTMTFFGAVTQTTYAFGGTRRIGWVDTRDVDGFLSTYDGPKAAFRLYQEPKVQVKVPVVPVVESAPETLVTINTSDGVSEQEASQAATILSQHEFESQTVDAPIDTLVETTTRKRRSRKTA